VINLDLMDNLKKLHITKAYIKNGRVYVHLGGYKLPTKIVKIIEHEPQVGSNYYGGKKVFIDNDIANIKHFLLSVSVHEAVEDWLKKTFFPDRHMNEVYKTIHKVAQEIEKKFHVRKWGLKSWKEYSRMVNKVWDKENE